MSPLRTSRSIPLSSSQHLATEEQDIAYLLSHLQHPVAILQGQAGWGVGVGQLAVNAAEGSWRVLGTLPAVSFQQLGDPSFCRQFGLKFPYVSGAMAAGIGSEAIVESMAREGMLGFFGAAGLSPQRVNQALDRLSPLGAGRYGFNLIHSPNEPELERTITDLYIRRGVMHVEASAFLDLTPNIVRYRLEGIHRGADGRVVVPRRVMAKVSRVEVAQKFLSPPPARMLEKLVADRAISPEQAQLAMSIPVADDLTAEADSGGHTDNRPLVSLLPTLISLRDRLQNEFRFATPVRVGAAGGIATPASAHAAFAMGAAYVVVGSVHQACVESGTSDVVRKLLAEAGQADCVMCPAADMFEMGVKVQVLKRGTMFAMRATKLYECYRNFKSLDEIPQAERDVMVKTIFQAPLERVWEDTKRYFETRDPSQIERAEHDPKHKMALVFRSYLGQSSRWANTADPMRRLDYQIWCGPAMGAFNEWTHGTFLARAEERQVGVVARNLMFGAAYLQRVQTLKCFGFPVTSALMNLVPRTTDELKDLMG